MIDKIFKLFGKCRHEYRSEYIGEEYGISIFRMQCKKCGKKVVRFREFREI